MEAAEHWERWQERQRVPLAWPQVLCLLAVLNRWLAARSLLRLAGAFLRQVLGPRRCREAYLPRPEFRAMPRDPSATG